MTRFALVFLSILLCLTTQMGLGKPIDKTAALFAIEEPLELELKTDFSTFLADRGDEPEYHRAYVSYAEGRDKVAFKVKIRSRGNFRKREANCDLPPIRVRISDKQGEGTIFQGIRHLKLVTNCKGEEYVLREYLVYRMFNLLTDQSFRVRLAKIRYVDTENNHETVESYGFFIEEDDDLAERLGGTLHKDQRFRSDSIDYEQLGLLTCFQYMVGNLDWSIALGKNVKFITLSGNNRPIAVPYDFDFSHSVNAEYTGLGDNFSRRDIKGLCRTEAELQVIFDQFIQIRPEIKELLLKFPYLKKSVSREMLQYTNEFFRIISNAKQVKEVFLEPCNG